MKRFKEQGWVKCELKKPHKQMGIPNEPAVYVIVFKTPRRKIIYVGSSKCVYKRISGHPVIHLIKRNIPNANFEIWYKNFRDISYYANEFEEAKLINELKPVFNLSCGNGKKKLPDNTNVFWKKMGIKEIKINCWRTDKVA
jgi:excinuclease UvrABC nuclease subunit